MNIFDEYYFCDSGTYHNALKEACSDTEAGHYFDRTKFTSIGTKHGLHTCAITENDILYCWGSNSNGQLGDGTTTSSSIPVEVTLPSGLTAKMVSTSYDATCAILSDDLLYCWGSNNFGATGLGADYSTPQQMTLPNGRTAIAVDQGEYYGCVILDDNSLYCWGRNHIGQLGDGTSTTRSTHNSRKLPIRTLFNCHITR